MGILKAGVFKSVNRFVTCHRAGITLISCSRYCSQRRFIVSILLPIVSFSNHRPRLERYGLAPEPCGELVVKPCKRLKRGICYDLPSGLPLRQFSSDIMWRGIRSTLHLWVSCVIRTTLSVVSTSGLSLLLCHQKILPICYGYDYRRVLPRNIGRT